MFDVTSWDSGVRPSNRPQRGGDARNDTRKTRIMKSDSGTLEKFGRCPVDGGSEPSNSYGTLAGPKISPYKPFTKTDDQIKTIAALPVVI